jgi:hypothetical protein
MENPVPVTEPALTATGAVPVDESVSVFVVDEPADTFPKATLEALTERVGTAAPS